MRARLNILAVVSRPPDPDGPPGDRALYSLLTRLARATPIRCLAQSPPVSWRTLKAALAVNRVDLQADWVARGDFFDRIRNAVRERDFSAIILAGSDMVERWLQPLRMLAPHQIILCYLPDPSALLAPAGRSGAQSIQDPRTRWGRLLSFADGVWVESRAQALDLQRKGVALDAGKISAVPMRFWNARELSAVLAAVSKSRKTRARSIEVAALGFSRQEAVMLRRSAGKVVGRLPSLELVVPDDERENGVLALNHALRKLRAESIWLCVHPFKPSENLFRTLWEGMRVLPFAGGAAPVDCARRPGAKPRLKDDLFAAAWAMGHKGDWHEVDHLSHFCCLVLRRRAVEAAGLLDERFLDPQYALIDYCLRLQHAGFPVYQARDALAFCQGGRGPVRSNGRSRSGADDEQRELLIEKWSKGSLKLMESLVTALEPRGYRVDPVVSAGFKGPAK